MRWLNKPGDLKSSTEMVVINVLYAGNLLGKQILSSFATYVAIRDDSYRRLFG